MPCWCLPAAQAAHHYFLGLVSRRVRHNKAATEHFVTSYMHNPFLFSAFEEACTIGHGPRMVPNDIFNPQVGMQYADEHAGGGVSQSYSEDDNGDEIEENIGMEGVETSSSSSSSSTVVASKGVNQSKTAKKPMQPTRKAPRTAGNVMELSLGLSMYSIFRTKRHIF